MPNFTVGESDRVRGNKRQQALARLDEIRDDMDTIIAAPLTTEAQQIQALNALATSLKDVAFAVRKLVERA